MKNDKNMEICTKRYKRLDNNPAKKKITKNIYYILYAIIITSSRINRKIGKDIHPVYTIQKIGSNMKPKESKPPIVNQICVVYHFIPF